MNKKITVYVHKNAPQAYRGTEITYLAIDGVSRKVIRHMISRVFGAKKVKTEFDKFKVLTPSARKLYINRLRKSM